MEQLASRSFLALPKKVRCRIYYAAGLVTNANIYLSRETRAELRQRKELEIFYDVPDLELSLNLLLTCRTIHEEVLHLLFSTNFFYVNEARLLNQLPVSSLSSLSFLKVYLNVVHTFDCRDRHSKSIDNSAPLNHTIESHFSLLEQWENAAERIGSHVNPQVLKLGLICDVIDEETARLAIEPLRHLPLLSGCEIRLGPKPNRQLESIARKAALKGTGQWPPIPSKSFPFLRLSPELRLMILEYTNLVTPLSRVRWDMSKKFYVFKQLCDEPHEHPCYACHPNEHKRCTDRARCQKCPHRKCGSCHHYACPFQVCCRKAQGEGNTYISGCFCTRQHAAYSPHCNCWRPPTSLFLVSKEFYQAAQVVFFSMNDISIQFEIHSPNEAPEITYFTNVMSSNALCNLRSLELNIYCPTFENLLRTFQHLSHITWNLQYLLIEVMLESPLPSCPDLFYSQLNPRPILANERGIDIVKETVDMIWPIGDLCMPSSAIRLFLIKLTNHDAGVNYYLRRGQEPLPFRQLDVDVTKVESVELHLERELSVGMEGNIDGSSLVPNPGDNVWIEGIVARPDFEGYEGFSWE
ncbi:hypothetical protein F4821DRAFT_228870 [Hypoxylon rubiginosum]|uniref:Uncharacterized protein n=1 Tax=Hypoxylon rubiginosum TaxID=110542 RepID=A0ACC0DDH2_9PEZI|nr:hypothetical protein F4821DRAFT_228870 [Hypoxylon rubiginosum]